MSVRILIVDNKASIRRRVRELLISEPGIDVVGEAADGQEAMRKARELKPDVVIMDVGMPVMNGLIATYHIKEEMPDLKVVMLTVYDLPEYAEAAMACGASGYVIKTALLDELVPAIARALDAVRVEGEDEAKDQRRTTEQTEGAGRESERLSRDTFEDMVIQEKVKIVRGGVRRGSDGEGLTDQGGRSTECIVEPPLLWRPNLHQSISNLRNVLTAQSSLSYGNIKGN